MIVVDKIKKFFIKRKHLKKKKEVIKEMNENFHFIGEFRNEFGELYFVYTREMGGLRVYFLIGDETSWEPIEYDYFSKIAGVRFYLNENEIKSIDEIINKWKKTKKIR